MTNQVDQTHQPKLLDHVVSRLRVKDIDLARREILVREGKGFKDRVTMLPVSLVEPIKQHLVKVQALATPALHLSCESACKISP